VSREFYTSPFPEACSRLYCHARPRVFSSHDRLTDRKTVPELVWTIELTHLLSILHTGRPPVSYIDLGVDTAPNEDGKDHRWTVVDVSSRFWPRVDREGFNICTHGDRPDPALSIDV
jgi:hypothetical protein